MTKVFFAILVSLVCAVTVQAESLCPKSFIEHAKWDGTDIFQGMPVNQSMCGQMPSMTCCKEFFEHQTSKQAKRKHIAAKDLAPFSSKAPGIESYQELGYCTGSLRSEELVVTEKDGSKITRYLKVRHYDLVTENSKGFFQINMKNCPTLNHPDVNDKKRAINGPPLFFQNGEIAEILVTNISNESTSVHWHGLELENGADGVPGVTQKPIAPDSSYNYRFQLKQDGTYWYHPHTLQEQEARGVFIVFPKGNDPVFSNRKTDTRYHYDRTILLTDYMNLNPNKILQRLQQGYGNAQLDGKLYNDLWTAYKTDNGKGFKRAFQNLLSMGMFAMDKSDVYYSDFFMNDERCINCKDQSEETRTQSELEFGQMRAGERVRLRIINGSTSSYFYLDYANNKSLPDDQKLPMMIVAKDGKNIKPIEVDQLYLGMGECYDIIVEVPDNDKAYELRLKSIDDQFNKRISKIIIGANNPDTKIQEARDVPVTTFGEIPNENYTQVSYDMLKTLNPAPVDSSIPVKYYELELMGNMENYYWQIKGVNGTKLDPKAQMPIVEIPNNTRIHVTIHNTMKMGMMNHPMHLHGQFFRLIKKNEKTEDVADRAFMHTATVFPGGDLELEFYSGNKGTWVFHCHNLYHMANSMMMAFATKDSVAEMGHEHMDTPMPRSMQHSASEGISSSGIDLGIGTNTINGHYKYVSPNGNINLNEVDAFFEQTERKGNVTIAASGAYSYCYEPNKCVTLNIDFNQLSRNGEVVESILVPGIGYRIQPLNNKLLTASIQFYTNQSIKASLGSEVDVAPNTIFEGEVGCEGKYCQEFEAGFALAIRPTLNLKLVPVRCSYKIDSGMYCGAEIHAKM